MLLNRKLLMLKKEELKLWYLQLRVIWDTHWTIF